MKSQSGCPAGKALVAFAAVAFCALAEPGPGQTPPPHPRLLFTGSEIPGIQARIANPSSPWGQAFTQCASAVSIQTTSSLPSVTGQGNWTFQRSLRRLTEVAFRFQMTGNVAYGNDARAGLLSVIPLLTPTGDQPYQLCTYACCVAIVYDMVYPLLSTAERSTVTSHLLAWVAAIQAGTNPVASFSGYAGCTDNFAFAWQTGVAMSLMAVWGDVTYPNIVPTIQASLAKIQDGWRDAISPDGSVDESYGYANYGSLYSIHAAAAANRCGLGDYAAGTNLTGVARWVGTSLLGSAFMWMGDSSPSHKGLNMDPVLYYAVKRTADPVAFWALERLFTLQPVSDNSATQAFSPYLNRILYYPENLTPQPPAVFSSFFRDNLNQGTPDGNKTVNFPQVGQGGHAILHNSTSSSATQMGACYIIRDEWMNHGHEDDGQLGLVSDGAHFFLDLGYAGGSNFNAQSTSHNIVAVQGATGFGGDNNNYFAPPSPNGRFLGRRIESFLARTIDFVHGDHANMWMLDQAERSVVMIKDPTRPYVILVDSVRRNAGSVTFEELFHSGGPASGAGTASSPMVVSASGQTLRSTWLSPAGITVVPGSAATASGSSVNYWRHKVTKAGSAVGFVSVHARDPVTSVAALPTPDANTSGGIVTWSYAVDRILARTGPGTLIGDSLTSSDGSFVWIRKQQNVLSEWAAAEATALVHAGAPLLASSVPVTASVRQGIVEVNRFAPQPTDPPLGFAVYAPFVVTEVIVDGQPTTFNRNGNYVIAGQSPPITVPSNDRCYTFTDGFLADAAPSGNYVLTTDGRFTSLSGWSGIGIRPSSPMVARPMAFGLTFTLGAGATGSVAGLRIESSPGASDILSIDVAPAASPGFYSLGIFTPTATLTTRTLPLSPFGNLGRFEVLYRPQQGTAQILDPSGSVLSSVTLAARGTPFTARAVCSPSSSLDNVSWFDSEEDGVTPQGVAFWGLPNGKIGCALRAPQVAAGGGTTFYHQGVWLPPSFTATVVQTANVLEFAATPFLAVAAPLPATLQEFIFESQLPAITPVTGETTGFRLTTLQGVQLFGTWTY